MPKNKRNGQATVLETPLLLQLWEELPQPHRVITQICYYAVSRVGEVCSLQAQDRVNGYLVIRRKTTKSKQSKEVPIIPELKLALDDACLPMSGYWFPADSRTRCDRKIYRINRKLSTPERNHFDVVGSKPPRPYISTQAVDYALRRVCELLSVEDSRFQGVSTHSFRRSAITHMASRNIPLRHIQKLSGHQSLEMLQRYIDVTEKQKMIAASALSSAN